MAKSELDRAGRRVWWALVINGALGIILGIFIIARPLESVAAFALVIAIWALVQGIVNIVHAFDLRPIAQHWWVLLLQGIVGVGFGVAALYYYPVLSLTFAVVWTSWWLMLSGIAGITIAVQERRAALPWGWTMTFGILGVVVGVYALLTPPVTLAALMGLIAAFGIAGGIVLFIGAYRLRNAADAVSAAFGGAHPA